ncbi:MAG TPA: hypothetical protein VNG35_04625 [Gemmatimonadales bacterium]|nr:hypothetical protein [Gemmatimonadales bacterium]
MTVPLYAAGDQSPEIAMHAASSAPARQSSTVDLMAMLLVLAGDHQASANANAKTLLRLAEPEPIPEAPHHGGESIVQQIEAVA